MKTLCVAMLLLISTNLVAANLTIYASDNPPQNYLDKDGKPTGHAVEIVEEIMKRVGETSKIQIVPWARGFNEIQQNSNVVLFSTARTEEREKLFKWVGPVLVAENVLLKKKTSKIAISTIEDAKKVKSIGTVRGNSREKLLKDLGFTNLADVTKVEQNIQKLAADRIDLMIIGNVVWRQLAATADLKPDDFEEAFVVNQNIAYIAFSKDTPDETVRKWNDAYSAMVKDGTVKKILDKWLPGANADIPIRKYIK